jgi:peptide/nickel transport system permease protein
VRVVLRRSVMAVPLLFLVSGLTFVLVSLTPGDPAHEILGVQAAPDQYPKLRHALGLDLPLYEQYWRWLRHALTGDLGASLYNGEAVTHAIGVRLPVTISLIVASLAVALVVGLALGVLSAVRGGVLGRIVDTLSLAGFALPAFWLAAALIALFAVHWRLFPATGYVPLVESASRWARSLVLPVIALSLGSVTAIAKQTREAMLDVLASEHIAMAWANGLSPRSIVFRHALRNAALPVVTVLGLQAVGLLGGTVFVESIFALPGVGGLLVNSTLQHDLPMVQGIVIYFTVIVVVVNLVIDLAYTWLNPRVRTS